MAKKVYRPKADDISIGGANCLCNQHPKPTKFNLKRALREARVGLSIPGQSPSPEISFPTRKIPYVPNAITGMPSSDCTRRFDERKVGEFNYTKCPDRKQGLFGDDFTDNRYGCEKSGRPDADSRGFGYDKCSFIGRDYRKCPVYISAQKLKERADKDLVYWGGSRIR